MLILMKVRMRMLCGCTCVFTPATEGSRFTPAEEVGGTGAQDNVYMRYSSCCCYATAAADAVAAAAVAAVIAAIAAAAPAAVAAIAASTAAAAAAVLLLLSLWSPSPSPVCAMLHAMLHAMLYARAFPAQERSGSCVSRGRERASVMCGIL